MKDFNLLKMDIVKKINKTIKLALLMIIVSIVLLFLFAQMPNAIGRFLDKNSILIAIIFAVLIIALNFVLLYRNTNKNPDISLRIDDQYITVRSVTGEKEYKILGLALVEIDDKSYKPAVILNFIYNENNSFEVMINSRDLGDILAIFEARSINYDKNKNP